MGVNDDDYDDRSWVIFIILYKARTSQSFVIGDVFSVEKKLNETEIIVL